MKPVLAVLCFAALSPALLAGCVMVHARGHVDPPGLLHTDNSPPHPEEAAILDVADKVLLAIGNHDYEAQKRLMVAEGTTFLQRVTPEGARPVVRRSNAQLMTPPAQPADPFIERYWAPEVWVRGDIAVFRAPYELRDNGQVVHCGFNMLDLVKLDGQWKVGNLLSTMEPGACDELRPPSVSAMRPRDGWRETRNE